MTDEDNPADNSDIVFCTYDKVTKILRDEFIVHRLTMFVLFYVGCLCEKLVEKHPQRWYDPCLWKGIIFCKVRSILLPKWFTN